MYDLPGMDNIEEVIIDANAAKGVSDPILVHSKTDSKSIKNQVKLQRLNNLNKS